MTGTPAIAFGEETLTGVEALRTSGIELTWTSDGPAPPEPAVEHVSMALGGIARGAAVALGSRSAARAEAARQAVARYVWLGRARLPARITVGTVGSLGVGAVSLDDIAGYSPALRARDVTALGWTRATEFVWVAGESLPGRAARWLPVQLVVRGVPAGQRPTVEREPELRPRVATGVAAHPHRETAMLDALFQVIERDAFMITWLCRLPAERLALEATHAPVLAELRGRLVASGLAPTIVRLATDVPVPVVLAVVRDARPANPAITVGVAARPTLAAAATEALARALVARRLVGDGLRAQRAVPRDTFRLDGVSRLLWWADARRADGLAWLLCGPVRDVPDESVDAAPEDVLDRLVAWLAAAGEEVVTVDLVDDAVARRLGHHVVAVVAPGFHPMHLDEARPARWSARVRTVPTALDLPAAPVLNLLPHPLAIS